MRNKWRNKIFNWWIKILNYLWRNSFKKKKNFLRAIFRRTHNFAEGLMYLTFCIWQTTNDWKSLTDCLVFETQLYIIIINALNIIMALNSIIRWSDKNLWTKLSRLYKELIRVSGSIRPENQLRKMSQLFWWITPSTNVNLKKLIFRGNKRNKEISDDLKKYFEKIKYFGFKDFFPLQLPAINFSNPFEIVRRDKKLL